ncbi:MAG TPA: outer membrane beta-barrel protein [Gemmatimonadales bacterium]
MGAALMAAVGAAPALAQTAKFSVGGGLTLPLGDFGDAASTGWHGLAAVGFQPANLPVGFQLDGMYQRFGVEGAPDNFDGHTQVIQGTANVVYTFTTAEASTFHPYLIGGVGIYNAKPTGDDFTAIVGDESSTDFGVNAGAGFDFMAGSVGLFVEGRFHNVFSDGSDATFIPISVGVRFGGGSGS